MNDSITPLEAVGTQLDPQRLSSRHMSAWIESCVPDEPDMLDATHAQEINGLQQVAISSNNKPTWLLLLAHVPAA